MVNMQGKQLCNSPTSTHAHENAPGCYGQEGLCCFPAKLAGSIPWLPQGFQAPNKPDAESWSQGACLPSAVQV